MSYKHLKTSQERQVWARERWEEIKACTISDRERDVLKKGVACVKAEFTDLDGLEWPVCEVKQAKIHRVRSKSDITPFAILTGAELSSFHVDETIRAPSPSKHTRTPAQDLFRCMKPDNDNTEGSFSDVLESLFCVCDGLSSEKSPHHKFQPTHHSHPVNLSPQGSAEIGESILISRPQTPDPYHSYAPMDRFTAGDKIESGYATGKNPDNTPRKKLRLPRLPKKYIKGSGTDPYNPRYHD